MNDKQLAAKEAMLIAESAIRKEVSRIGLDYMELSPIMRELLASTYIRGGIDAIEKAKDGQKHLLENA